MCCKQIQKIHVKVHVHFIKIDTVTNGVTSCLMATGCYKSTGLEN